MGELHKIRSLRRTFMTEKGMGQASKAAVALRYKRIREDITHLHSLRIVRQVKEELRAVLIL